MTKKISLVVQVPALGNSFDFLVPESMVVSNIINLIAKILTEEYKGLTYDMRQIMLVDKRTNLVLNKDLSCKHLGIVNGSKLLLF